MSGKSAPSKSASGQEANQAAQLAGPRIGVAEVDDGEAGAPGAGGVGDGIEQGGRDVRAEETGEAIAADGFGVAEGSETFDAGETSVA